MSDTPRPNYSYEGLLRHLSGGRNKNDRPTNKSSLRIVRIGGEPVVRMYSANIVRIGGEPVVRMYSANIGTFHSNGTITINVGGWEDSVTTRANVGETTGASIFTVAQRKKRVLCQPTRIYTIGVPSGLPFANGCIVKNGSCIWHPAMKEQGVDDVRNMTEKKIVINKEKAAPYYKARKALLKRIKPMLHFIDENVLADTSKPYRLMEWLEDVLFNPPGDEDLMIVACQLVEIGKSGDAGQWWKKGGFDADKVSEYVRRGLTKCVGASSWDFLDHIGALETVKVRCMDV